MAGFLKIETNAAEDEFESDGTLLNESMIERDGVEDLAGGESEDLE